jgi:hypothetical protein
VEPVDYVDEIKLHVSADVYKMEDLVFLAKYGDLNWAFNLLHNKIFAKREREAGEIPGYCDCVECLMSDNPSPRIFKALHTSRAVKKQSCLALIGRAERR